MIVFDVGANHGMVTLFFSKSVLPKGKVVSFEPNPKVYQDLVGNIKVNNFSNIETFQLALESSEYQDNLIFDITHTGTGSLNAKIKDKLRNLDSNEKIVKVEVNVVSLDYLIPFKQLPSPEFIKIDVEGFEFDVLKGMNNLLKNKKPEMFIEIHGATFKEKESNIFNIVKLLKNYDYFIKHVVTNETITTTNTNIAREGHIYCI
jgi:FkbM family methyltransferase